MSRKDHSIEMEATVGSLLPWEELLARVCFLEELDPFELPLSGDVREAVAGRLNGLSGYDPLRAAAICFKVDV